MPPAPCLLLSRRLPFLHPYLELRHHELSLTGGTIPVVQATVSARRRPRISDGVGRSSALRAVETSRMSASRRRLTTRCSNHTLSQCLDTSVRNVSGRMQLTHLGARTRARG